MKLVKLTYGIRKCTAVFTQLKCRPNLGPDCLMTIFDFGHQLLTLFIHHSVLSSTLHSATMAEAVWWAALTTPTQSPQFKSSGSQFGLLLGFCLGILPRLFGQHMDGTPICTWAILVTNGSWVIRAGSVGDAFHFEAPFKCWCVERK
jgi:hypothetical protein